MSEAQVLLLPGWQGSGPGHWLGRWEALHGHARVEQHDWLTPRRGDWLARLEETVIDARRPLVLVAHDLGCLLVAAWARHSRHGARVRGALLVAPADLEQSGAAPRLPGWTTIVRDRLPFASLLVASRDDPRCAFGRAQELAQDWGSRLVDAGARGHLDADAGLGDWPEGLELIRPWLGTAD
ncbi:MAG: hypothetical protein RJA36_1015 [Pseudomonadota bacterium]|jgi:predicted alpha/beta hydrolase family esterase